MNTFALDPHLQRECFALGRRGTSHILLMNNAAVPWFLIVPETTVAELYELDATEQDTLRNDINDLSRFIKAHFAATKINVGAMGNIVKQLHIHVIGRNTADYCWPGVVWGTTAPAKYSTQRVNEIRALAVAHGGVT